MCQRIDKSWSRGNFETLIYPDPELAGDDGHLDCAELCAFDLPRNRSELTRRINLALDTSAGILFDGGGKIIGESIGYVVDSGRRNLHDVRLVVCARYAGRQCACESNGADRGN